MSALPEVALKSHLLQLKCHFTWRILEKDADIDGLEDRLCNQLIYPTTNTQYMMYNLLAYIKHLKGLYTEAIANLKKAEETIKQNNPDGTVKKFLVTYGDYAWVYYYFKQYENCQKYIDKIDQINTQLNDSQNLAEIYGEQGWSLLKFCGKYYEKAKECFEKALEIDPENPEWNSGYAKAVYRLEGFDCKKFPASECKSLSLLQHAIELNPSDVVLKALLALKLQDLDRVDEGRQYVEKALEQAPNNPYLIRYVAKFYRRSGLVDEALRVLKPALDIVPSSSFLHHQIGLCYRKKLFTNKKVFKRMNVTNSQKYTKENDELVKKAIFHFEKAVENKKDFVYALMDLADMYSEAKDFQKAENIYKTALALPSPTDEEKQQIHLKYGYLEEYWKKSETEAIKHYKEGFQIMEPSESRSSCEKALKRLSEWKIHTHHKKALGFGLLGFVNKYNGNTSEAIEYYEKALKYDPYNEEYLSDLCDLKLMI